MSSIAALIGMVCVCAVAVSALGILSPNGMTSKALNLVIGVFMVCVMIAPVKNFSENFHIDIDAPTISEDLREDAQNAYNKAVISETKTRLEKALLSTLTTDGYKVNSTDIKLNKNNDGGIYISDIDIYIDKEETHISKIIRQTEEKFDITPQVIARQ